MFNRIFRDIGSSLFDLSCENVIKISQDTDYLYSSFLHNINTHDVNVNAIFIEKHMNFAFSSGSDELSLYLKRKGKKNVFHPSVSFTRNIKSNLKKIRVYAPCLIRYGKVSLTYAASQINDKKYIHAIEMDINGKHSFSDNDISINGGIKIAPGNYFIPMIRSISGYLHLKNGTFFGSISPEKRVFSMQYSEDNIMYFMKFTKKNAVEDDEEDEEESEADEFAYINKFGGLITNEDTLIGGYFSPLENKFALKSYIKHNDIRVATKFAVKDSKLIPTLGFNFRSSYGELNSVFKAKEHSIINKFSIPFRKNNTLNFAISHDYKRYMIPNGFDFSLQFDH